MLTTLTTADHDRIIQMAWEDRTPFEAIELQWGLNEAAVITLIRSQLTRNSFNRWRIRVTGRKTKHKALRSDAVTRFKSYDQKGQ